MLSEKAKHWRFLTERFIAPATLVLALLVLLLSAFITHYDLRQSADSARWVAQSRDVLEVTEGILSDLILAESASRGYWLSNNADYRTQFEAAAQATRDKQTQLAELTLDNELQRQRVEALAGLIDEKLNSVNSFVAYHQTSDPEKAKEIRLLDADTQRMSAIRDAVREIQATEDELLKERESSLDSRLGATTLTLIASTLVASSLVLGTYHLLRRHWSLQRATEFQSRKHLREKDELARYIQRLLESTGEGIYGIDNDGVCTFMNRAGAIILGGEPSDFLNHSMHELVHHTTADGTPFLVEDCPIFKASTTGEGCRVDNEVFWRLDGQPVPVEYSSFPLKNGSVIEGAVVTFMDISARLQSRRELQLAKETAEAANEAKTQFLANMSHELRTPLNAIIMYSELLVEESQDRNSTEFIPDLERIRSAGRHLLQLVNGVLDLSKVDAGKMELYPEEFQIETLISEIASTASPFIEKNGNELQVEIGPHVDSMYGDVTRLRQILYNLLSNASKFTQHGTIRLCVSLDAANDSVVFQVTDSGIGMTQEQLARLFQPFVQADASTTRKYGGTGLGLAIVRRFTELMHGTVTVTSQAEQGTVFSVTIPRHLPLAAAPSLGSPSTNTARSNPTHPHCNHHVERDDATSNGIPKAEINA